VNNVLVCGGGSGGHLYPALAMLEAFKAHPCVRRVGFVGTHRALDAQVFGPLREVAFFPLHAQHLRGSWAHNLKAIGQLGWGMLEAFGLMRRFRPSLIVGTGGYASFPALLAGMQLKIPTAIFEPNAQLGLVNRLLGPRADRVFCDELKVISFPHRRVVQTGIPLRKAFFTTRPQRALYARWGLDPRRKTLLVLGGSLGASVLNVLSLKLAKQLPQLQLIVSLGTHQTAMASEVQRAAHALPNVRVLPYIERMDEAMALADVALCRAGALTLAELSACGVPALVVPWEGAAGSHHVHNAQRHVSRGAGAMLRESELNLMSASQAVERMLAPQRLKAMRDASLSVGARHRGAGARILEEVETYLNGNDSLYRHRRRWHECSGQGVLAAASSLTRVQHRVQLPHD